MLLTQTQIYAVFFLAGCFTVKSISELQNWSSRRDMSELWIVFILILGIYDAVLRPASMIMLGGKWASLIVIFLIFYREDIEFMVADDQFAFLAAISVLSPLLIPVLLLSYIILIFLLKNKVKHDFSHTKTIPTLPMVTISLAITTVGSIFL